jgi:hypothetical protein
MLFTLVAICVLSVAGSPPGLDLGPRDYGSRHSDFKSLQRLLVGVRAFVRLPAMGDKEAHSNSRFTKPLHFYSNHLAVG